MLFLLNVICTIIISGVVCPVTFAKFVVLNAYCILHSISCFHLIKYVQSIIEYDYKLSYTNSAN